MPTTPQQYYYFEGSSVASLSRVQLPEPDLGAEFERPTDPIRYYLLSEEVSARTTNQGRAILTLTG